MKSSTETKVALIRINIKDKIQSLKDVITQEKLPLNIIFKGEIVGGQDTFIDKEVKDMEKLLLVAGKPEMAIWKRFPKEFLDGIDYYYCNY